MKQTKAQRWGRQRGSALLLTLLLTLAGAVIFGMAVDATSLLWVRSSSQTTANLVAAAVALEQERNPGAPAEYLLETARAAAARNGVTHGTDSAAVSLEQRNGKTEVLLERYASVYFLRMIRPQPVAVRARATASPAVVKAAL